VTTLPFSVMTVNNIMERRSQFRPLSFVIIHT